MPHVIVTLWPGNSESQKRDLSDTIVRDVTRVLNCGAESVLVGFESPQRLVFERLRAGHPRQMGQLLKQPGYGPGPKPADEQIERRVK